MCGLYSFRRAPEEARSLFNYVEMPDFPPRQYVTPGSPMAIVRQSRTDGQRHFALTRWGFVPSWVKEVQPGKPLINARAETVAEKPSFRNAFKRRRCLIPADGFYEWEGDIPGKKKPWFIHREDHGLMAFAGLWEHWVGADGSELETSVIITTEANVQVGAFHPRSPVIIPPDAFERWLDCGSEDTGKVMDLLKPVTDDFWIVEPTTIQRNAPPPKPVPPKKDGGQMSLI